MNGAREKKTPASSQRTAPTPGPWIQVRLAFWIGTTGFAFGARCFAGRVIAAGRFATLGARLSFETRAFTRLLSIARTVGLAAWLAITRAIGISGTLSITWTVGLATGLSITRTIGIPGAIPFTGSITGRAQTAGTVAFAWRTGWWERRAVPIAAHGARRREQFVHGQLAVVVLVERAQRFGGAGDFIFRENSVAVFVEGGDDWQREWPVRATGFAEWWSRPVFTWGDGRAALRRLSICEARRQSERECDDDCSVFHGCGIRLWVCWFGGYCRAVAGTRTRGDDGCSRKNCEASVNADFASGLPSCDVPMAGRHFKERYPI